MEAGQPDGRSRNLCAEPRRSGAAGLATAGLTARLKIICPFQSYVKVILCTWARSKLAICLSSYAVLFVIRIDKLVQFTAYTIKFFMIEGIFCCQNVKLPPYEEDSEFQHKNHLKQILPYHSKIVKKLLVF